MEVIITAVIGAVAAVASAYLSFRAAKTAAEKDRESVAAELLESINSVALEQMAFAEQTTKALAVESVRARELEKEMALIKTAIRAVIEAANRHGWDDPSLDRMRTLVS